MSASQPVRNTRLRDALLTVLGLALLALALYFIDAGASTKFKQACTLFAVWGVAAISLNLINGTTGILSLGHHGFMLVGGYTTALLTLPELRRQQIAESARSQMNDFTLGLSLSNGLRAVGLDALTTPETLWVRFVVALLIGGLVAALFGLVVGIPSLRLRGDYLAIVTFGFGEIIRLLASTSLFSPFTNGSLGYTGVPPNLGRSLYWTFGILALTVFVMTRLKYSSYGRALQSIREDEIAAEAMGVNLAYHKVLAFALSAFFAGVAGGLYASWLSGARLDYFLFTLTFFFLVAVSVGGTGSFTGVLLGTASGGLCAAVRRPPRAELSAARLVRRAVGPAAAGGFSDGRAPQLEASAPPGAAPVIRVGSAWRSGVGVRVAGSRTGFTTR